jgi:hypothetical protein
MLLCCNASSHSSREAQDEQAQSMPIDQLQGPEEVGVQVVETEARLVGDNKHV